MLLEPAPQYPKRATLWGDEAISTSGGARTINADGSQRYGHYAFNSSLANGDACSWSCVLRAGTYTLKVLGLTNSASGLIDWVIDGSNVVTGQDWYSAGTTYNVLKTASVTVAADGYHTVTATVNGLGPGGGGWFLCTKAWFEPSAD